MATSRFQHPNHPESKKNRCSKKVEEFNKIESLPIPVFENKSILKIKKTINYWRIISIIETITLILGILKYFHKS